MIITFKIKGETEKEKVFVPAVNHRQKLESNPFFADDSYIHSYNMCCGLELGSMEYLSAMQSCIQFSIKRVMVNGLYIYT